MCFIQNLSEITCLSANLASSVGLLPLAHVRTPLVLLDARVSRVIVCTWRD